ncbi:MAG: MFS transporter [Alphaproteobacteria bacterium]|nr:MFS transporter [Alphaproteobacteria bacterium]
MRAKDQTPAPVAGLPARRAGLDILSLVRSGKPLDEALEACRSFGALEGADRAFARALASTVLRRQGTIDTLIGEFVDKPLPKRAARATEILRLAAAQSAILDLPDHAVVSTAVALAQSFRETQGYAGLINAVARKIARTGKAAAEKLPARADIPGWLWRRLERAYGPATARAIARAHREEPPLDLTPKRKDEAAALAAKLGGTLLPTGSIRLAAPGEVTRLPGFEDGAWWVQDAAAALPAKLLGDVAGKRVFDLCAAPGGKTMQLAASGARVVAVDVKGPRLKRVADNLARTGLAAETVKADILDWAPAEKADAILLDAPCSATGVARRHPDILRSRSEDEIEPLARLQAKLIDKAVSLLAEGGLIVYATCSLLPEEGERQIEAALQRHSGLKRAPVAPEEISGLGEALTRAGEVRTLPSFWPETGGMDGFFAARLRREAAR